jgi:hypothetical protein
MFRLPRVSTFLLAASAALLAACTDDPNAVRDAQSVAAAAAAVPLASAAQNEIAELRRALAPYHRLERAIDDQYDVAITPCWYHSDLGAMGYHYGDPTRIDGTVERLKPEALVYEPLPGGKYRLVAAEYIVPITAWQGAGVPTLFGQPFDRNDQLGIYALHVWAWIENPAGIFAPWNEKVTCDYAAESEDRS